MYCFSAACDNPPFGDFICSCNRKKFFCEEHQNGISEERKSCQLGWQCLNCAKPAMTRNLQFITIFSENNALFMVCSNCAIVAIDPWIATMIEEEKENVCTVDPAREGSYCEKCSAIIVASRPYDTKENMKKSGWVWNDGLLKHRYCLSCISSACAHYM